MGRNKYSQEEVDEIARLLRKKCSANRYGQRLIRHTLRVKYEFNIADFNIQGKAFTDADLQECIKKGIIQILSPDTIAQMKKRRKELQEKDLWNSNS